MLKSGLPIMSQASTVELRMAAQHAKFVVMATWEIKPGSTAMVLPGLNPNQPSQRISPPRNTSAMLWPGMGLTVPSDLYLPSRGPSTRIPARPDHPPTA